ncbi:MAG: SDR family oxidoreductase [Chloroflexi bacterium]|nr:SDR family oxidoreductase [Chloroflexota bacterium]
MANRLKGKVAVVTGSGQGIGKGIALAMAKEGAKVVTNNRKPGSTDLITQDKTLDRLSPELKKWVLEQEAQTRGDAATTAQAIKDSGGEAVAFFGDVGDFKTAGKLIQTAVDSFGRIDILVNNAGSFERSPIWEMTPETWRRIIDVHLNGNWNCIRQAAPLMKEQRWGRIINCTSEAQLGMKTMANYSAAKGGIVSLTRAVAKDLWEFGITCNAYSPSARTRPSLRGLMYGNRDRANVEALPLPEAVAPFIVYLATEEAAHISGSIFKVAGGHIGLLSEPAEIAAIDKGKGIWTVDELVTAAPKRLLSGYKSPATQ